MIEQHEDAAYTEQDQWIREHLNDKAADSANYGWFVDEVTSQVATKVYGYGVLTTTIRDDGTMTHDFEDYA